MIVAKLKYLSIVSWKNFDFNEIFTNKRKNVRMNKNISGILQGPITKSTNTGYSADEKGFFQEVEVTLYCCKMPKGMKIRPTSAAHTVSWCSCGNRCRKE